MTRVSPRCGNHRFT